jgi:hypothetical protein
MEKTDEVADVAVEVTNEPTSPVAPLTTEQALESVSEAVLTEATKDTPAPQSVLTTPTSAASSSTASGSTAFAPTPVVAETPKKHVSSLVHPTPSPMSTAKTGAATISVDRARDEISRWLQAGNKLSHVDNETLHVLLKDHDNMKDKVGKLKGLLGRSAKAQREAKVDLDATQKRLDQTLRENDRLNKKIDKLANRPTHMELLADFETNFDRAMLAVGQSGGQESGASSAHVHVEQAAPVVETLLLQELTESKQRIERLEGLNTALSHRSNQLEADAKERKRDRDGLKSKVSHLELEKRMAVMEAEHATRAMQEKAASLAEMQMEIDMVTRASVSANARAAHGEKIIKTVKTDRQHVLQLESQVEALQEWALASAEAKTLAQERVRLLENQLMYLKQETVASSIGGGDVSSSERILFSKSASLVVGAGDVGTKVITLDAEHLQALKRSERVVLRWQFELKSDDYGIVFSVLKGVCDTPAKQKIADYLIQNRKVTGGAAGETENAFAIQNAATVLWSNVKSWVRPKTVKYRLEAVVMED